LFFSQQFPFVSQSFYSAILPLHFGNLSTEFDLQFVSIWLQALDPSWKFPSAAPRLFVEIKELLFVQTEPKQKPPLVLL